MKAFKVLGVLLILLVAVAFAVDRIGVSVAEAKVASTFQQKYDLATKPDVSINGFPFLTQAISGTYGDVRINARDVPVQEIGKVDVKLRAEQLELPLNDAISGNVSRVPVGHATATLSAPFSAVAARVAQDVGENAVKGVKVTSLGGNKVQVTVTREVLGVAIPISAQIDITATGGKVSFAILKLSAAGIEVPAAIKSELSNQLTFSFDLPPIVASFDLTEITVVNDVISLTGKADNLVLQ